jgi:hypothetical protein
MSYVNSSDSDGSSNIKEEDYDETSFLYEIEEDEAIYEYESKKKPKKKVEDEIIKDLKPKKNKFLNEGGAIMRPLKAAIYQLEKKRKKKEALYLYDEYDVVGKTIYEQENSKEESVYSKGKIRNKETTISKEEKEERIGRYSDMEVDYTFDEKPYHDVQLEEVLTEGKPAKEKKPRASETPDSLDLTSRKATRDETDTPEAHQLDKPSKKKEEKKTTSDNNEQDADIEDIIFDD